jgi:hypothetical protein
MSRVANSAGDQKQEDNDGGVSEAGDISGG